jgi:hypothetical protein
MSFNTSMGIISMRCLSHSRKGILILISGLSESKPAICKTSRFECRDNGDGARWNMLKK